MPQLVSWPVQYPSESNPVEGHGLRLGGIFYERIDKGAGVSTWRPMDPVRHTSQRIRRVKAAKAQVTNSRRLYALFTQVGEPSTTANLSLTLMLTWQSAIGAATVAAGPRALRLDGNPVRRRDLGPTSTPHTRRCRLRFIHVNAVVSADTDSSDSAGTATGSRSPFPGRTHAALMVCAGSRRVRAGTVFRVRHRDRQLIPLPPR